MNKEYFVPLIFSSEVLIYPRKWIDNIKMDISEIGLNVVDWIGLAQDRYRWRALVNSIMKLRIEELRLLGCFAV
jgi:hypothetical protein